jgi:phosphotransferase system HPr-like phosphotransfer protein
VPGSLRGTSLTIKGKIMRQFTIKLKDIKDVKDFVTAVNAYTFDVDLVTGRYITDAKSIMGVLSLDLEDKLVCVVHTDESDEIAEDLAPFIVTE